MKHTNILKIVIILLVGTAQFCQAQFIKQMNPWGFAINNPYGTYSHHFFDIDSNESIDHLMSYATANSAEFIFNFNKNNATALPNFANCTNELFMNYWQMTDSVYGLYQPDFITLGATTKFFDLDNDGDQDIISSALTFDANMPDNAVTAYTVNENNRGASPNNGLGFECLYYFDNTKLKYNLPAKVSTDSIAVQIFDIGHLTTSTSKDIIALELGAVNSAMFVLYQDISTGNSPSFLARQNNPFGLANFTAENPSSMPLLIDADNDGDNDIIFLAGADTSNLSWYYYQNTGSIMAPDFSTPYVVNPFGLNTFSAGNTQDNLIVLYKIDGNKDGKDDIIFGNNSNIFYFENNYTAPTPNAISQHVQSNLNVYPNPVQDILHIDIDNLKSSFIKIIDSKGNTILSQQASPTISTNQLAGGVYYLLMFDSKNNIVAKKSFIKR